MILGISATVRESALWNAVFSVSRSLFTSVRYRCWLLIQRPDSSVACASQLPPPAVDEVSQPLRAENPASRSRCDPWSRTASTCGAYCGLSTAERP